jgi:hypothetical protein
MTQSDLGAFGASGLTSAKERAQEYRRQLEGVSNRFLRMRLLEYVRTFDPVASRLLK